MMLATIIGLVLVIMTFFPVGQAIAKGLGIITARGTELSYQELTDFIREVGGGKPNSRPAPILLTMDDDSAIMGFSSGSQGLKISRGGQYVDVRMDFSFARPAQCSTGACVCVCKDFEHESVFGSEGYYCKTPKIGEPEDKYLKCSKDLGTDIISSISKELFAGDNENADYGVEGGFFMGRLSWANDLLKSDVFNMPGRFQIWVERGSGNFVAVCLHSNGCIDAQKDQEQVNVNKAFILYNEAWNADAKTKEGSETTKQRYETIIADQALVDGLRKKDPDLLEQLYLRGGMSYYHLFVKFNEGSAQQAVEAMKRAMEQVKEERYKETLEKNMMNIKCEYIDKKCECYESWANNRELYKEWCQESPQKCYQTEGDTSFACRSCSEVKSCGDYYWESRYWGEQVCNEDPCKIGGCKWELEEGLMTQKAACVPLTS
ncbi:MAG TPA: hypothetical protein VJC00_03610 [Candidatus Nanoarchaeia archaeon]|nr:hypothetical protein [Candidatus Nanoarchaeia archaeon]